MKHKLQAWLLAVGSLMVVATAAIADDYPTRPVKLIISYAPGGAGDSVARLLGQRLSQTLKQPFIVENRPGGGSMIGANQTAKAAADGYTLMVAEISQFAIVPHMFKEVSYDPINDFTPICLAVAVPLVIVSNAKTTTIKTLPDLVRQAKANPGKLNYGSTGIGSIHHLAMEAFKSEAGIDIVHIPYKGSSESLRALLSGEIQLVMAGIMQAASHAKSDQAKLLATTSAQRFPGAPEVPTVSEFYNGYDYTAEIGVVGPAGLSPKIVSTLSTAIKTALDDPEMKEKLGRVGMIPSWLSPQDYAENIRQNIKKYERAVALAHITPK